MQKEDNEIDLGLFLELEEENKILYNQTPVNILIQDGEKPRHVFFTNGYFSLGDEGEINTNRFFKDSQGLSEFIDKILVKYDDHPSIYYTGNNYRFFKNFDRLNRSEHGRCAKKFNNFSEYEGENYYIPSEMVVFSNVLTIYSRKIIVWSISNACNHTKEEQMLRLDVEYQNFANDIK